jgi:CheY-like chemotaxis protein
MADLLHRTVAETISIECKSTPDLWMCEVDSNQMESAILNLAINARDAMPDGGKLTIELRNADLYNGEAAARARVTPGEYVVVAVADTGIGMSREIVEKVFEPFFTSKDVGKGSGLGLSMVYCFVNQSGGHVTIDSTEGEGTTVNLYLPRCEAVAAETVEHADQVEMPEARGETILIVEDDPDVREISVDLLSSLGYTILEAIDGQSALSIAENETPIDLLFTDVVLSGGISGPELAEKIKHLKPTVAVLYTSGYTKDAISQNTNDSEDINLLRKPFLLEELASKVRSTLDNSAS